MYCMNCGVKLGTGEERCPLCGLRACHPDLPPQSGPSLYPREWVAPKPERSGWRFLLTVSFNLALFSCLLVDLLLSGGVSWSGYVTAGLITAYLVFVLPMWFSRPNMVIFLPIDFAAVLLMLLYIDLASGGGWFLSFAFPVCLMYGLLATAIAAIARYVHRGWFFLLGGSCIALGCSTMLLELFLSITFHTRMFVWSLYPLATLSSMGLFWILAGIIRPLGNALRKRMFV